MSKFGWSYPPGAANDPYAPYNQDEGPILEDGVAGMAAICPACGETADWYTRTHWTEGGPGGTVECIEEGWECGECGWEQEALDEDYERAPSADLMTRHAELNKRLGRAVDRARAWGKEHPMRLEELDLPQEDFNWEDSEAGDWHVYNCGDSDCPIGWHRVAYALDFKRENGVLTIESRSVDEDGNWDFDNSWSEEDGEPFEKSWFAMEEATQTAEYFAGWAAYWLDCAMTRKDPAEDCLHPPESKTPTEWFKFCLDAAEDNIKYLEGIPK